MKNKVSWVLFGLLVCFGSLPTVGQSLVVKQKNPSAIDCLASVLDFDRIFNPIPFSLIINDLNPSDPGLSEMECDWHTVDNFTFGKDRGNTPMVADLDALHPYFRDKIVELINRCHKKGIELAVVESYRTRAKQAEYYSMGKKYTRSAGGKSKHQYGLAVDLVPIVNGEPQWDNKALWRKIGVVGESLGLRWGGRWRSIYDPAHFEWTGGLSGYHLANGILPSVPAKNYPCIEEDLEQLKKNWAKLDEKQSTIMQASKSSVPETSGVN